MQKKKEAPAPERPKGAAKCPLAAGAGGRGGGSFVQMDYMAHGNRVTKQFWRNGRRKRKKRINHRRRKAMIRAKT